MLLGVLADFLQIQQDVLSFLVIKMNPQISDDGLRNGRPGRAMDYGGAQIAQIRTRLADCGSIAAVLAHILTFRRILEGTLQTYSS